MKSLVIIPTYNEIENINSIVKAVFQVGKSNFDILIIDDGSPDGTADAVESLMKTHSNLFLQKRSGKLGLGTAYIHGFKWAIQNNYDFVFEMDADFSHDPKDLPRLLEACIGGASLAIGSRYVKGGSVSNWTLDRKLLSFGASLYVRLVTGMPVKDPTAGFKCYRISFLKSLDYSLVDFKGYAFQIAMKYQAFKNGLSIVEVPVTFKDREVGTSKMNMSIFKEALVAVLKIKFSS